MAGKVKDLVDALKGPVTKELHEREGRTASGSYKFAPLDVRQPDADAGTTHLIPHDYKPSEDKGPSDAGAEGEDSEGKKKPSILR